MSFNIEKIQAPAKVISIAYAAGRQVHAAFKEDGGCAGDEDAVAVAGTPEVAAALRELAAVDRLQAEAIRPIGQHDDAVGGAADGILRQAKLGAMPDCRPATECQASI